MVNLGGKIIVTEISAEIEGHQGYEDSLGYIKPHVLWSARMRLYVENPTLQEKNMIMYIVIFNFVNEFG